MGNPKELWLIVADSEKARLLHGTATQYDHVHLDEVGKLETTFAPGEHHRPTRLSQPGRSGPTGQEHEIKTTHFAQQVAQWIEKEVPARGISRCAVFAPTHLLGALRKSVGKAMAGQLTEHSGELAELSLNDLSKHPKVVALMRV